MVRRPDRAITLPNDPTIRNSIAENLSKGRRGLDRGVLSAAPLEDMVIGQDFVMAAVDVGHLPFLLSGLSFISYDRNYGEVVIALYRLDIDDIMPAAWTARLSGFVTQQLVPRPYEYVAQLPQPKMIDRTAAAWFIGVQGSESTVVVRGCQSYGMPSFSGWSLPAPPGLPDAVESGNVNLDPRTPAVGLLTLTGLRLRGTGIIGA